MTIILPLLFVLLSASFGLFVNLKMPNLTWTSEIVPIKQSMGVLLSIFGGWVLVAALGALYFALMNIVTVEIYLLLCCVLALALSAALLSWLKNKGAKIFAAL